MPDLFAPRGGSGVLEVFDSSVWQQGTYSGGGGFAGALTKASEGRSFADPAYPRHMAAFRAEQRRNPAFIPGAYHFSRADLGNRPEDEADWFLTVVGDLRGMLLAHDAESAGGSQAWCQAFADRLAARLQGYEAAFYSYRIWIVQREVHVARSWLWLAWPDANGPLPSIPPWGRPAMQQYGVGPVPGLVGNVDRNRFFGSLDALRALTVGGAAPLPASSAGEGTMLRIPGPAPDSFHLFAISGGALVRASALVGGLGNLEGWLSQPGNGWVIHGSPAGAQLVPGSLSGGRGVDGNGAPRVEVHALASDGRVWTLGLADNGRVTLPWDHLPAPAIDVGVPGPPGPDVTDDHIGEVARAAVKARL